jgi:shikimate dehydrogenase
VRLPAATTRVFALLGDPVAHSLSPRFQNAALAALGLDGVYTALRCAAADLPGLLRGLARAGGGGNVTVPHKALAARSVDVPGEAVARTGACNTFWLEDGLVHGDNTDVEGVRGALHALLGRPPAGASVLLLGAGSAAAAVLSALADDGAERVLIANRTAARAEALAAHFRGDLRIDVAAAPPVDGRYDLAIHATSLGLHPGDPLPPAPAADAALDLVYAPGETAWVRAMRARGVPAADGREMLLCQGAAAFRRWWGIDAPLDAMRAALADPPS